MSNEQNLTMMGKAIDSTQKAQELGKLGGLQKGINSKKKKTYKEQLKAVIELGEERALEKATKEGNTEAVKMIEEGGLIAFEKLNIALNKKVKTETRLKALDSIVDRLEGKPTQKNEHSGLDGGAIRKEIVYIDKEEKTSYENHINRTIEE